MDLKEARALLAEASDDEPAIDYRHDIGSLVRKPGAFARYRYREELFPSFAFRQAYDALSDAWRARRCGARAAAASSGHDE